MFDREKMFGKKAQVSTETVFAVSIALLLLVMVLLFASNMRMQSDILKNKSESSKVCYSLAGLLSKANTQNFSKAEFLLDRALTISGNNIFSGDVSCKFFGTLPNVSLVAGTIEIKKTNQLEVKNV